MSPSIFLFVSLFLSALFLYAQEERPSPISPPSSPSQPANKTHPSDPLARPYITLMSFLKADTLSKRLPHLSSTKENRSKLLQSTLDQSLPSIKYIKFTNQIDNPNTNQREYFYSVVFKPSEGSSHPPALYIQVSEWGDNDPPKINTNAFIDLYSDRLKQFAETPSSEPITAHVITEAYRHNFNTSIPNYKTMGFLKIRSHPGIPPILNAYFNLQDSDQYQIAQPLGLPWGKPCIATITIAWNNKDPEKPYIQLIKINGLTWSL